jgi:DNA-directed RNA polymerase subunit RPC12/RpoP
MPVKIPEAAARLYAGVWICRRCKKKIRGNSIKVRAGKIPCPNCGGRVFRPKSKERRLKVATAK